MASCTEASMNWHHSRFRLTQNLESYQLLWLDQNMTEPQENLAIQKNLRGVINQLKVFNKMKDCEGHLLNLSSAVDEKVVLIIADQLSREFLALVHDLKQLCAIYVYCTTLECIDEWKRQFSKIRGVFYDSEEMINRIKKDQYLREKVDEKSIGISIYNLNYNEGLEQRNAMFMHFQLFLEIILNMKPTPEKTKKELLDFLRVMYRDNDEQLRVINEFDRNYSMDRAVWWYTKYTLFYSFLNKALRNHDFDILTAFRFFIRDLFKQLSDEHQKYRGTLTKPIIQVYRGQAISEEELKLIKDNVGEYISMNSFLSTTTRRDIGELFAESSTTGIGSVKRILFEFHIDSHITNSKPFADIRHLSHFAEEDEVLICLGTIFRIKDMNFNDQQNLWIAKLELCSSDDFVLKEIFEHEKTLMQPTPSLLHLGKLLGNMGSYEKQKTLIQQILNESEDALEKENCYLLLGQSARFLKDYDMALENNFKCLELQEKAGVDDLYIGQTYITIAEVHFLKLEFDLSLEYAKKSLILVPEDHLLRANAYRLMGKTHSKKAEYELSLDCCKKALEVQQKTMPKDDKDVGLTYYWMAVAYENMNSYSMALECFNESLRISRKTLPPTHENIRIFEEHVKRMEAKANII
ncbi:unnamed protein product [Rotaria socialis]|uniref:ADP ribosyltransferase domain-containing protein n=1 Tax=Rotaria socialis TaxID=392032 RepID=A0A817VSM4_9BILA|nr:unnamed protein product [Rotaria socialis]CAF3410391.1 unnamed protein product [Rotaria socialis]CAF3643873.1 unnamed protein product [Rotaria socialis]CAF4419198.1 unnamed protein product [Rotaria socialis]CAF4504674.1 unnamed protein product [Rotaria socialis]